VFVLKDTHKNTENTRKMFQKLTIGIGLALLLPACSILAPVTDSRYVSADGALQIRGELVDSTDVRIFVNGDKVIDDHVSLLNGDGDFAGTFQGAPVRASCATAAGRRLDATVCTVAVAGERVKLKL
jgi:hypothetical protein